MNYYQHHMFDAAKEAVFAEASRLFADGVAPHAEVVACLSDMLDQLDKFAKTFVNKTGVEDKN